MSVGGVVREGWEREEWSECGWCSEGGVGEEVV